MDECRRAELYLSKTIVETISKIYLNIKLHYLLRMQKLSAKYKEYQLQNNYPLYKEIIYIYSYILQKNIYKKE